MASEEDPQLQANPQLQSDRARWRSWLSQAEEFARTDNHVDAVARVRLALDEVNSRLKADPTAQGFEREQTFFSQQLRRFEAARDAWHQSVKDRSKAYVSREHELYDADRPGGRLS